MTPEQELEHLRNQNKRWSALLKAAQDEVINDKERITLETILDSRKVTTVQAMVIQALLRRTKTESKE